MERTRLGNHGVRWLAPIKTILSSVPSLEIHVRDTKFVDAISRSMAGRGELKYFWNMRSAFFP
jgi:hypothetical protein